VPVSVLGEEKPVQAALKQESVPTIAQRSFLQDLRGAWASPQTRIFFAFLGLTTIFFYAQDIILEPFGAQVFSMSTAVTSRFSSYWGSTTLVAIVASLLLTRRFPKTVNTLSLSRWGVITLVFTFGLFFVSAVAQVRPLVTWGLVALGIGLGMWTVGTLGLMMDMTRVWGAGLYLSLWTVSETLARGIGSVFGGLIRDLGLALSGQLSLAYGAVFLLQAVGFALTLILLSRVNVDAFLRQAPAVETVFSKAMD
jgi:BCD family chlorophyll transporter-like MFS transporter